MMIRTPRLAVAAVNKRRREGKALVYLKSELPHYCVVELEVDLPEFDAKSQNSKERKNTYAGYTKARRGWEAAITLKCLLMNGLKD